MKPPRAVHLSPEIYARFAAYLQRNLAWGVFHVWLDDGNYKIPVPWTGGLDADATAEERELWAIFRQFSPSQMKKLSDRCEEIERARRRTPAVCRCFGQFMHPDCVGKHL